MADSGVGAAEVAINYATAQIGKPYQWGATGPNSFDCSGLVQSAYRVAGINLPRTSYAMLTVGKAITFAELEAGDLCFPDPGHVQLYIGGGQIIEAPHSGAYVRRVPIWGGPGLPWQGRRVTTPAAAGYAQLLATSGQATSTTSSVTVGAVPGCLGTAAALAVVGLVGVAGLVDAAAHLLR